MTHNRKIALIPALALALGLSMSLHLQCAFADEQEGSADGKYMFTDEIKPGMKGYGLSVFSGTKVEKFDVEITSVIYNIGPQSDMILARIAGGPIAIRLRRLQN